MSEASKLIDSVARRKFIPALRRDGYSGSGRTFTRGCPDSVLVVHVQGSSGNVGQNAQFAVNVGVSIHAVDQVLGPVGSRQVLGKQTVTWAARLGPAGLAAGDYWWVVDTWTDPASLGDRLLAAWDEYGKTGFGRASTLAGARDLFAESGDPLCACAASLVLTDLDAAQTHFDSFLEKCRPLNPRYCEYVAEWGERIGLTVRSA